MHALKTYQSFANRTHSIEFRNYGGECRMARICRSMKGNVLTIIILCSVENSSNSASLLSSIGVTCCIFASSAAAANLLNVRIVESGAPVKIASTPKKREAPFVGVFERSIRKEGESECQVCSGMTAQMTRCPRCSPGQPAIHAVCEEEWLMRHGKCMFCRLPVRKPLEPGAHPQDTLWSWR